MPAADLQFPGASPRAPLSVPAEAKAIHDTVVQKLKALVGLNMASCTNNNFVRAWQEIGSLADLYQHEIISHSSFQKTCAKGCAFCCCHWVDDVCSFEVEIIADRLNTVCKDAIPGIINRCKEDVAVRDQLKGLVEARLSESGEEFCDDQDLLLSVFYQMQRLCPLLQDGACMIYEVRPLTCRNYVSFAKPDLCCPEIINESEGSTYLFGFEDAVLELLEKIHKRFLKFDGEYGLRALLLKYLDT